MAGKKALHMVHGEWMTIDEAARRLGLSESTLYHWRWKHRTQDGKPGLLVDAWDFYDARRRGLNPRAYGGKTPKTYRYRGKRMSIKQIAERMGVYRNSIYLCKARHGCTMQEAIDRMDRNLTRRAEKQLVRILIEE